MAEQREHIGDSPEKIGRIIDEDATETADDEFDDDDEDTDEEEADEDDVEATE